MQGQTVLVTGATSGIGRVAALHFAALGANVVASGRRADAGRELIEEIQAAGGRAVFVAADVTNEAQVQALVARAEELFGALDCAFNNAGLFRREPRLHEHDTAVWMDHVAVGLTGVYLCMKYEVKAMLAAGKPSASIVNNASTVGMRGSFASGMGYTAVKHGVVGLTRQAAVELAGQGIRVNAVCPGPTLSEATASLLELDDAARREFLAKLNPTGEFVDAEHIAATVAFLCSAEAAMINGQAVPLDGGQLAGL